MTQIWGGSIALQLNFLFETVLEKNLDIWKIANVVPAHKKDKKTC